MSSKIRKVIIFITVLLFISIISIIIINSNNSSKNDKNNEYNNSLRKKEKDNKNTEEKLSKTDTKNYDKIEQIKEDEDKTKLNTSEDKSNSSKEDNTNKTSNKKPLKDNSSAKKTQNNSQTNKPNNFNSQNETPNNSNNQVIVPKENNDDKLWNEFINDSFVLASLGGQIDFYTEEEQIEEMLKWKKIGYRVELPQNHIELSTGNRYVYSLRVFAGEGICNTNSSIPVNWRNKNYIGTIDYLVSLGYDCTGYCDIASGNCY